MNEERIQRYEVTVLRGGVLTSVFVPSRLYGCAVSIDVRGQQCVTCLSDDIRGVLSLGPRIVIEPGNVVGFQIRTDAEMWNPVAIVTNDDGLIQHWAMTFVRDEDES